MPSASYVPTASCVSTVVSTQPRSRSSRQGACRDIKRADGRASLGSRTQWEGPGASSKKKWLTSRRRTTGPPLSLSQSRGQLVPSRCPSTDPSRREARPHPPLHSVAHRFLIVAGRGLRSAFDGARYALGQTDTVRPHATMPLPPVDPCDDTPSSSHALALPIGSH